MILARLYGLRSTIFRITSITRAISSLSFFASIIEREDDASRSRRQPGGSLRLGHPTLPRSPSPRPRRAQEILGEAANVLRTRRVSRHIKHLARPQIRLDTLPVPRDSPEERELVLTRHDHRGRDVFFLARRRSRRLRREWMLASMTFDSLNSMIGPIRGLSMITERRGLFGFHFRTWLQLL